MANEIMLILPVRECQIRCVQHPEWGAFGILEETRDYYIILGDAGTRVLSKLEAQLFWEIVRSEITKPPVKDSIVTECFCGFQHRIKIIPHGRNAGKGIVYCSCGRHISITIWHDPSK